MIPEPLQWVCLAIGLGACVSIGTVIADIVRTRRRWRREAQADACDCSRWQARGEFAVSDMVRKDGCNGPAHSPPDLASEPNAAPRREATHTGAGSSAGGHEPGSGVSVARRNVRRGVALGGVAIVMAFGCGALVQAEWISMRTADIAAAVTGVIAGLLVLRWQWQAWQERPTSNAQHPTSKEKGGAA